MAREPRHVALAPLCDVLPVCGLQVARQIGRGKAHRIEAEGLRLRPDRRPQIRIVAPLLRYARHTDDMGSIAEKRCDPLRNPDRRSARGA
jgi:hypothetical protein